MRYGDGSTASGDVHLDTITIGDITIKRQAVEVAQKLSNAFLEGGSDGLLGLACEYSLMMHGQSKMTNNSPETEHRQAA